MTWPKHNNPDLQRRPERVACAPYNFIPLPEVVVPARATADELPDHSAYQRNCHSGYFTVRLRTRAPLYIRCGHTFDPESPDTPTEFSCSERQRLGDTPATFRAAMKNVPGFFYGHDRDQPVIPGSSLRGMLRSVLEIASYGKMERVDARPRIFYRAVAAKGDDPLAGPYRKLFGKYGENINAGYLVKRREQWFIQPAQSPRELIAHEGGSYLKVRSAEIDAQKIPDFIPLSAPDYTPQYHPVSFDIRVERRRNGIETAISNIQSQKSGLPYRGVLVGSGNMRETGEASSKNNSRTNYVIVLPPREKATLLSIAPTAIDDYVSSLTPFLTRPPFHPERGALVEGRPVFFIESGKEVRHFGHSPYFRVASLNPAKTSAATPRDFVPSALKQPEIIDFADALFGFVRSAADLKEMKARGIEPKQGDKGRAYAGRVSVTDASLVGSSADPWLLPDGQALTPRILASPKPTAFQHYLVQTDPHTPRNLRHYDSPTPAETVIRGHKRYWHQNGPGAAALRDDDVQETSTHHTQMRPVRSDVEFEFRVYFTNLSDTELGALCWTLHPHHPNGGSYCHSLGMGKPLGMGSVQLRATLHLTRRCERYTSLFAGEGWQTGEDGPGESLADLAVLRRYVMPFEQHIVADLQKHGEPKRIEYLGQLPRIAMLLKMMAWPGYRAVLPQTASNRIIEGHPNTRYMTIELPVPSRQKNEYRERPVLPDPFAWSGSPPDVIDETWKMASGGTGSTGSRPTSPPAVSGRTATSIRPAPMITAPPPAVEAVPPGLRAGIVNLRYSSRGRLPDLVRQVLGLPDNTVRRELARLLVDKADRVTPPLPAADRELVEQVRTILKS